MSNSIESSAAIAIGITALAATVSALLILALYRILGRYASAQPNFRSSHRMPTPQGAGIAVLVGMTSGVGLAAALHAFDGSLWRILVAAGVMACLGFVDDVHPLPALPRLLLQAIVVAALVSSMPDQIYLLSPRAWWIERVLLVLGGLWFINMVNFMDGIDLMTVAEIIPLTATLAILGAAHALPSHGMVLALALGGAMLGFAYFNRPPARIFLGDVGSLPIGLLLAWLLFLLAANGHVVAALVMPLYYVADAGITLIRRILRGEMFWQAHRTHFYQRATDHGFAVGGVVARVFAVNIGLCGLAVMTVLSPGALSNAVALVGGPLLTAALLAAFARGGK